MKKTSIQEWDKDDKSPALLPVLARCSAEGNTKASAQMLRSNWAFRPGCPQFSYSKHVVNAWERDRHLNQPTGARNALSLSFSLSLLHTQTHTISLIPTHIPFPSTSLLRCHWQCFFVRCSKDEGKGENKNERKTGEEKSKPWGEKKKTLPKINKEPSIPHTPSNSDWIAGDTSH